MILSAQTLRTLKIVEPFHERTVENGMSFGLSYAGYDIRIKDEVIIGPRGFTLASSLERFEMPVHVLGQVCDKSTWARRGLSVFNTIIEPGWRGWLTLELVNHSAYVLRIPSGSPIAQVVFSLIDRRPEKPYNGKYQDQKDAPQPALLEDRAMGNRLIDD